MNKTKRIAGSQSAQAKADKPASAQVAADTARYEALAREHGVDLSETGFDEALRKIGKKSGHGDAA